MELKPCPFCGGFGKFYHTGLGDFVDRPKDDDYDDGNDSWGVKCTECEAESQHGFFPPTEAAKFWNTRKPEDLAAEKRRFAERLVFDIIAKSGTNAIFDTQTPTRSKNTSNDLIEYAKAAAESFFGKEE